MTHRLPKMFGAETAAEGRKGNHELNNARRLVAYRRRDVRPKCTFSGDEFMTMYFELLFPTVRALWI